MDKNLNNNSESASQVDAIVIGRIMAKAKKENNLWIKITHQDGSFVRSRSVEDHLLFIIFEKMEEIRCNKIDIETEIQKLKEEAL